mgnify:CR=1 FL=1
MEKEILKQMTKNVKIIRDENGIIRMYVDFNAFFHDDPGQKIQLYTSGYQMHLVIGYYDPKGQLYIAGLDAGKYKAELEAQEGKSAQYTPGNVSFNTGKVKVSKLAPQKDVVVIAKGKSSTLRVQTKYYNILSPRKGTYYLGAYLNGSNVNMLEPGKSSINAYFNINMTSGYGDVIGDGKYGINSVNKDFGFKFQQLKAYCMKFDFKNDSGILNYLNGKLFKV